MLSTGVPRFYEALGSTRRRVFIEDSRRNGVYLRTTWHAEAGQFVISTWNDEVCTGAVRVPAADAPALIGVLADGLADAMAATPEPPVEGRRRRTHLLDRIRAWIRRRTQADVPAPRPSAWAPATGVSLLRSRRTGR